MRMNLQVPFAEKDQAKKLGARWDGTLKVWYVPENTDLGPFAKWCPTPGAAVPASAPRTANTGAAKNQQATGKFIVGSAFVEQAPRCDCLPWDVCNQCEATALKHKA